MNTLQTTNNQESKNMNQELKAGKEKEQCECSVCYQPLTVKNSVSTPCNHLFCSKCFFKWLKESNTCPLCRNKYTEYTKWDYEDHDLSKVTNEFNMFKDIIHRTKDALSEHHIEKTKLEKYIKDMNKAVEINNKYIKDKQQSCLRMNNDLEYKRGFYKASHFPITEIDLYNLLHDDQETTEWKKGFRSGFEKKYNCDILNDYTHVVDPFILQARTHLNRLAKQKNFAISVEKFDRVKNNIYKLVHCISKYLSNTEFKNLFSGGVLKNDDGSETVIGMPLKIFETSVKNKYMITNEVYVDFMYDSSSKSWFKTPYYINEYNEICYFDYEVKLNKVDEDDKDYKMKRKRKYTDITNVVDDIIEKVISEKVTS